VSRPAPRPSALRCSVDEVCPRFYEASGFVDGLALVQLQEDGYWVYIDPTGKVIWPDPSELSPVLAALPGQPPGVVQ
jgi:hypothetical protein